VESATNIGMVSTATGNFLCQVYADSKSITGLGEITSAHEAISGMSGLKYTYYDGIPRWTAQPDSALYTAIRDISDSLYGGKPDADIVHRPTNAVGSSIKIRTSKSSPSPDD
jgi:hypothetical protein